MSLIKITRGKKKKLIENLIDNRDYMDNAGIVISEANILKRCELIALRMNYIENMFDTLCGGFEYGEEAMEHINRVIQNRLDRLKLSPQEIAEIAHGKAVPSIQDVIENEWRKEENERIDIYHKSNFIARKLARGRTTKALNGDKPAGMCPFGYQYTEDKKHVVINPEEGKVVKLMFTEAQKGRSLQQIADTLNAKGYKSRRGNDWVRGSVGAILNNRFYIGELTHQGETIQGTHEPLISKIQFGKVSASLTRRHR